LALFLRGHYSEKLQAAEIADLNLDTLVAAHDSELIGFAQIRTGSTADGVPAEAIELQRFYLDRLWHGSGLAGELMHQSIECARQRHAPYIWLGVWERNPRAIAFYEKSGFKRVGCKTFLVGNDLQHDLVLLRELTDH
jgi:GNAT superfamily N-acetyltransferase